MKRIILAAALLTGTAAFAQPQPDPATRQGPVTEDQATQPTDPATPDTTQPSANPMPMDTDTTGQTPPATGTMGNQPMQNQPINQPMQNMPMQNQSGMSQPAMGQPGMGGMAPRPATMEYPRCSRTVTDSCIQTNERGMRRPARRRR